MATTTVYPDANPETTSVDGYVGRDGADESWATIIAGAGTTSNNIGTSLTHMRIVASATTDQFAQLYRSFYLFDTSSIDDADSVSAATLSIRATSKTNSLGSPDYVIVSGSPSSDTALATGDFGSVGSTLFGSVTYANISTAAYTDITLNGSGKAAVSKTGISKFAGINSWDFNGTFGGSWSSGASATFAAYYADLSGTSSDPKLVVTHAPASTFTPKAIIF